MIQYDMKLVSLLFTLILSSGVLTAQTGALGVRIGETRASLSADDLRALPQRIVTVPEDGGTSRYEGPRFADDGPFRLVVSGDRRRTRWVRQVAEPALLAAPDVK